MKQSAIQRILGRFVILCFLTVGLIYVVNMDAGRTKAAARPCCSSCEGGPGELPECLDACNGDPNCEAACQHNEACWRVCLWSC